MRISLRLTATRSLTVAFLVCFLPLAAESGSAGSWESGQEVYAKVCGYCHQTGIGPIIKGRALPPEYIAHVVRRGQLAMPAFPAEFIDDQALQAVADYISSSATGEQK